MWMSHASLSPSELDLLCEQCGYVLNNLPADGRCPECGALIAESSPILRLPSPWEQGARPRLGSFVTTTQQVIFSPSRFFRSLEISGPADRSGSFAMLHATLASLLFGAAGAVHIDWLLTLTGHPKVLPAPVTGIALAALTFFTLTGVTLIAARLTHWEATYRGLRMPLPVVRRGLRYHAAHYLPVSVLTCVVVFGYKQLVQRSLINSASHDLHYIYTLGGAAILGAIYLFNTYWIGMRNLMYANRVNSPSPGVPGEGER